MSDNSTTETSKDCDECQKTLKEHLKKCADYGIRPDLIEKCADLPGGCNVGVPECCPAPPPPPPVKVEAPAQCNIPTITFICPATDCVKEKEVPKVEDCLPPKVEAKPKCPPPPTKVEQCPPKPPTNNNNCDTRPLNMDKPDKC